MIHVNILALDIGGTAIKVATVSLDGTILASAEYPSEGKKGGPHILNKICEIISSHKDYDKIGISTTGQVDSTTGNIVFANENVPNYTGMELGKIIADKFGVPVAVENDVNAAALGEAHYGAGKEYSDFLCLTYGTGVGGAIIMGHEIYGGSKGVAGEFGHIITHPEGLMCGCGQKGCYEQYASTTALVRMCMAEDSKFENGRIIFEEMHKGNSRVQAIINNWIDEIVLGLRSLVHIFNPSCLILGGGILEQDYVIQEINSRLHHKIMPSYAGVVVRKALLGNNAGVLGATHLVLKQKQK